MSSNQEVQAIVHSEIRDMLGSLIVRFWWTVIGLIFASAAAWYSLYYQVQGIERQVQERQETTQRDIDLLRDTYQRGFDDIKSDIRYIRERI